MRMVVGFPGVEFCLAEQVGTGSTKSSAEKRFLALVEKRMAETGEDGRKAEYAVALTLEGKTAWEEARRECLRRG